MTIRNTSICAGLILLSSLLSCADSPGKDGRDNEVAGDRTSLESKVSDDLLVTPTIDLRELRQFVFSMEARPTRDGRFYFGSKLLNDPRAVALVFERIDGRRDGVDVRAALVRALIRTGAPFAGELESRWDRESSQVRIAMLWAASRSLRHSERAAAAAQLIARGLSDSDAQVRAQAALGAERCPEALAPVTALLATLDDSNAQVRAASARALGILRVATALPKLDTNLEDSDSEVRLQSLRAAARIDRAAARAFAKRHHLASDSDSRIARAASTLVESTVR